MIPDETLHAADMPSICYSCATLLQPMRDDVVPDTPSDLLSRYLLAHRDEVAPLIEADGYSWTDIAALLAEEERLTDETGKPVTALSARLAWSRRRRAEAPRPRARHRPQAPKTPPRGSNTARS